ncbi:MAG: hypothetical protein MUC63_02660 [Planctomycetes bacterium]|jgi:hypothetical protein|nr:hypothetical protein [Planctomycetota bacterium]
MNAPTVALVPPAAVQAAPLAAAAPHAEEASLPLEPVAGGDPALPPDPGPASPVHLAALADAVRAAGLKIGIPWTHERCRPAALLALSALPGPDSAAGALNGLQGS